MDEELKNAIDEIAEKAEEVVEDAVEEIDEAVSGDEEIAIDETDAAPEEESVGNIKISVDVVSTIAGIAATEVEGVAEMYSSFAGGIAEKLGAKKNTSKGVKVEMNGDNAAIDLYIVVNYGVRIPELAWEIQENVKKNVESMTGLEVSKVNIHIEGVKFVKEAEEETPDTAEETAETAE